MHEWRRTDPYVILSRGVKQLTEKQKSEWKNLRVYDQTQWSAWFYRFLNLLYSLQIYKLNIVNFQPLMWDNIELVHRPNGVQILFSSEFLVCGCTLKYVIGFPSLKLIFFLAFLVLVFRFVANRDPVYPEGRDFKVAHAY